MQKEMINKLFKLFFEYEDENDNLVNITELLSIIKSYSDIWNEFRDLVNKKINDKVTDISYKYVTVNNKKYVFLVLNFFDYIIIDVENNIICDDEKILNIYLKRYNSQVEKIFGKGDFYNLKGIEESNITDLIEFIKNNKYVLENSDIVYKKKCDYGAVYLIISISSSDVELYFNDIDGNKQSIFFDSNLNVIESKNYLNNKEKLDDVVKNICYVGVPSELIPNKILKKKVK